MNPTTVYDKFIAALTIWREARGETLQAQNGVFHVILNRVAQSPKNGWPSTVHGVCVQPYQFSSFNKNDPGCLLWPLEKNSADWQAWLNILTLIDSVLLADPTSGATFYFDDSITPPYLQWLGPTATLDQLMALKTCTIGRLSFFKI